MLVVGSGVKVCKVFAIVNRWQLPFLVVLRQLFLVAIRLSRHLLASTGGRQGQLWPVAGARLGRLRCVRAKIDERVSGQGKASELITSMMMGQFVVEEEEGLLSIRGLGSCCHLIGWHEAETKAEA